MYSFEPTGIWLSGDFAIAKLIPYEEITEIKKISLAESILTGLNPIKPGLSEDFMGVVGDPLHVVLIETKDGRYLVRDPDLDTLVTEATKRIQAAKDKSSKPQA